MRVRPYINLISVGIIKYRDDLNTLIEEIGNEMYSKNFEDLFDMNDGKQVLAESYYNLAVILILLDNLIPGDVREQMVILHVRMMGG